jgi:hypothetical protein
MDENQSAENVGIQILIKEKERLQLWYNEMTHDRDTLYWRLKEATDELNKLKDIVIPELKNKIKMLEQTR